MRVFFLMALFIGVPACRNSEAALKSDQTSCPAETWFVPVSILGTKGSSKLLLEGKKDVAIDLRKNDSPVKDQLDRGSCNTFSVIGEAEHILKMSGHQVELSTAQLWSDAQGKTQGSFTEMEKLLHKKVVVSQALWPYVMSGGGNSKAVAGPLREISERDYVAVLDGFKSLTAEQMLARFDEGLPTIFGTYVNGSFWDKGAVGKVTTDAGIERGGHMMLAVGIKSDPSYSGGGYLIVKNSWGACAGDKGYFYVPLDYCTKHECSFRTIESVSLYRQGSSGIFSGPKVPSWEEEPETSGFEKVTETGTGTGTGTGLKTGVVGSGLNTGTAIEKL